MSAWRIVDAPTRWPSLSTFTLDPLVPARRNLGGEPLDERGDLGAVTRSHNLLVADGEAASSVGSVHRSRLPMAWDS